MVFDGTDGASERLTDGPGERRWQPLWSPDGTRLAWGESGATGFALVVTDGDTTSRIPMDALPFFSMWSPDGETIATLHNGSTGLDLEVVDVAARTTEVTVSGAPLYFAWKPDGSALVNHVGGASLGIQDSTGSIVLAATDGDFQAPWWVDSGIVSVERGELVLRDGSGSTKGLASLAGPTSIVAAPTGNRVALRVFGGDQDATVLAAFEQVPEIPRDAVVVLDYAANTIEIASDGPAFGFFWSPDERSLLILAPAETEGEVEWIVWSDGKVLSRVSSAPSIPFLRDVVPFFDQYAQAWTPWSPDSESFAFVGSIDGISGVWVQDLSQESPLFLTAGDWVAWSSAG